MIFIFRRFFAYYLDSIIVFFVCFIFYLLFKGIQYGGLGNIPNISVTPFYFLGNSALIVYFCLLDIFNIQSIGKKITKIKVLGFENINKKARLKKTIIRNISRLIPFEPFSVLLSNEYEMWHDSLSKTKIIDLQSPKI